MKRQRRRRMRRKRRGRMMMRRKRMRRMHVLYFVRLNQVRLGKTSEYFLIEWPSERNDKRSENPASHLSLTIFGCWHLRKEQLSIFCFSLAAAAETDSRSCDCCCRWLRWTASTGIDAELLMQKRSSRAETNAPQILMTCIIHIRCT